MQGLLELGRPVRLGQAQQPGMPPQCPGGATPQLVMVGTQQAWQCPGAAAGGQPGQAPGATPQNLVACPLGGGYYDLQYADGPVAGQSVAGRALTEAEITELAFQENVVYAQEGACTPSVALPQASAPGGMPAAGGGALPGTGALPAGGGAFGLFPGFETQTFLLVPARRAAARPAGAPPEDLPDEEAPVNTAERLAAVGGLSAAVLAALALSGTLS